MNLKRLALLTLSILLVLILVLASCKATTEPTTTPTSTPGTVTPTVKPTTTTPGTTTTTTPTTTATVKPKYGGMLTVIQAANITVFDPCIQSGTTGAQATNQLTQESLNGGDWAKGPTGTGEYDLKWGFEGIGSLRGQLAASWEVPKIGTMIFKIKKGITWALDPASAASKLVNGREYTADDTVYNFNRYVTSPMSSQNRSEPAMAKASYITKTAADTVEITCPVSPWSGFVFFTMGVNNLQYPREVIEKYGNIGEWKNQVGTGPFMLTDFVNNSSATLVRNPNWWDKDRIGAGTGNQLPYIDGIKILIAPDMSTRLAAIRTGKTDWIEGVTWADAAGLTRTNPELKSNKYIGSPLVLGFRTDKQDLPFKDKKVRNALQMAIEYKAIVASMYGGQAEILGWPLQPIKPYKDLYIPLDKQPAAVQELYSYNVDKAKKLLAEAGYANGFTVPIIVESIPANIDLLSVIKGMWTKIGVTLDIQAKESGAFTGIWRGRQHEQMIMTGSPYAMDRYANFLDIRAGATFWNISFINDPVIEAANNEIQGQLIFVNWPRVYEIYKGLLPYILEQSYVIPMPAVYSYAFWQPYVKGYNGELMCHHGHNADISWAAYAWIDQDLQNSMKK